MSTTHKIGIITFPLNSNYGNILQAYALLLTLKKLGGDVELIDKRQYKITFKVKVIKFIQYIISKLFESSELKKNQTIILNYGFESFIKRKLTPKTKTIFSENELTDVLKNRKYKTLLVGSDQVWRSDYMKDEIYLYFLSFGIDTTKCVSYSASFGTDIWQFDNLQTEKIKELLHKFGAISVREDSGVALLKQYVDVEVTQLIDPTLLLTVNDYVKLIDEVKSIDISDNIFLYILDNNDLKESIISQIKDLLSLPIVKFTLQEMKFDNIEINSEKNIQVWLKSIYNSSFVITDSFHGTVFAILFNKPFVVLANSNRGLTRISSLLKMFGLESRLIIDSGISTKDLISDAKLIDWKNVNDILEFKRKEAINFLNEHVISG